MQGGAVALDEAVEDGGRGFRIKALHGVAGQAHEGCVGAQNPSLLVDGRDGHGRLVEETGESHLGGAQVFGGLLAGRAIEHQGPGGAGLPILPEGDPVQQPHWQALPIATLEVNIELFGLHGAGPARHRRHEGRPVACDNVRQFLPARADLGQIIIQPPCERGVHIGEGAVPIDGEEARRRVIEKVDGVLEFLKDIFVALALARHVRDHPEGLALCADSLQRAHPHPVPAHNAVARQGRGHAQILRPMLAFAGGLGEAVDGFGDLRRAGKKPLDSADIGGVAGARHGHIGVIRIDDLRVPLGHQQPLARRISDLLGDVIP